MSRKSGHGHDTAQYRAPANHCFGCGQDNPQGMRLRFRLDEGRNRFVGRFRIPHRFQGPPGHVHGGIIATILDEAMGKVNKLRSVIALTRSMAVEYLKPVPLGQPLTVEGWEVRVRGRRHKNAAEIRNQDGEVLARSEGLFIAIDPQAMFGDHIRRMSRNRGA
ncbi:MAG: PaaI family thioesterase [Acidobacteria bacterium]|nr:PaaI family thioesterase [Acidobacteriota bacterium]